MNSQSKWASSILVLLTFLIYPCLLVEAAERANNDHILHNSDGSRNLLQANAEAPQPPPSSPSFLSAVRRLPPRSPRRPRSPSPPRRPPPPRPPPPSPPSRPPPHTSSPSPPPSPPPRTPPPSPRPPHLPQVPPSPNPPSPPPPPPPSPPPPPPPPPPSQPPPSPPPPLPPPPSPPPPSPPPHPPPPSPSLPPTSPSPPPPPPPPPPPSDEFSTRADSHLSPPTDPATPPLPPLLPAAQPPTPPPLLRRPPPPPPPIPASILAELFPGGNCPDALDVFNATNTYRERHQAPPLAWSATLAKDATAYAQALAAKGCRLKHASYGENLMQEMSYPKPRVSCVGAIKGWYSQVMFYNFNARRAFSDNWSRGVGHFTQLVWKASSLFGCGVAVADYNVTLQSRIYPGGCKMVVCRYRNIGNIASDSEFMRNVLPNITAAVV